MVTTRAPRGLRPLLRHFQERLQVDLLREPVIAFGQCGGVSEDLVRLARQHGWKAHLVLLEEPDEWIGAQLPVDDIGIGFTLHSHVVVCIDGWYVDFTRRQFFPKAPFPLVTPERSIVTEHWGKVTEPATVADLERAAG